MYLVTLEPHGVYIVCTFLENNMNTEEIIETFESGGRTSIKDGEIWILDWRIFELGKNV